MYEDVSTAHERDVLRRLQRSYLIGGNMKICQRGKMRSVMLEHGGQHGFVCDVGSKLWRKYADEQSNAELCGGPSGPSERAPG